MEKADSSLAAEKSATPERVGLPLPGTRRPPTLNSTRRKCAGPIMSTVRDHLGMLSGEVPAIGDRGGPLRHPPGGDNMPLDVEVPLDDNNPPTTQRLFGRVTGLKLAGERSTEPYLRASMSSEPHLYYCASVVRTGHRPFPRLQYELAWRCLVSSIVTV
ncbi:hypothetical protein BHM03_00021018 [Ensete ventricosum]|nr:hypothetical protein BHM03_00021018 [Ensete ventricosum]